MALLALHASGLVSALLGVLCAWIGYRCYIWPRWLSPFRHLPGPKDTWWPWGHLRASLFAHPPGQTFLDWTRTIPHDGLLVFRVFGRHQLVLTSAAMLREVLQDRADDWRKPPEIGAFLGGIIGDGIVLSEGDAHRRQRKQLLPAFHTSVIRQLHPLFWQKGRRLVERLGDGPCACFPDGAARAALDIIGVAGFAHDFDALGGRSSGLVDCYQRLLDPRPMNVLWLALARTCPPWVVAVLLPGKSRQLRNDTHQLRQEARALVQQRRARPAGGDVLAHLLADPAVSDASAVDQALTLLVAGHETSAAALGWVVYLLALHPDAQRTLRAEIRHTIPALDAAVTHRHIDALPFLHAVCQEALRLYPIAPVTGRTAARDTVLGGVAVPQGTAVMLAPWAINRSERYWRDPATFQPARWMHGRGPATPYAFLTFLHGPRRCLGHDFAQGELKCLVSTLVGRYAIALDMPPDEVTPHGFLTLKPKTGLRLHLTTVPGW